MDIFIDNADKILGSIPANDDQWFGDRHSADEETHAISGQLIVTIGCPRSIDYDAARAIHREFTKAIREALREAIPGINLALAELGARKLSIGISAGNGALYQHPKAEDEITLTPED